MKKRTVIGVIFTLIYFAVIMQAQAQTSDPEHKKLEFWIGKWKIEAEAKPNPLFPEGKYYATMTAEWFEGQYHVLCRYNWTGALGPYSELNVLGYDPEAKACYNYAIDSFGGKSVWTGTVKGNVWTYSTEMKAEGKPVVFRWSVVDVSPGVITWKSELSVDGGPWILAGEAKAKRDSPHLISRFVGQESLTPA